MTLKNLILKSINLLKIKNKLKQIVLHISCIRLAAKRDTPQALGEVPFEPEEYTDLLLPPFPSLPDDFELPQDAGKPVSNKVGYEPDAGELGILVVDDWQGRGVGRALMPRLLLLAAAEGITRVRAQAWSENEPIQRLLKRYPYEVLTRFEEGEMRVELDLQALGGASEQT